MAGWFRMKDKWHKFYMELEGLDYDSSMEDSWSLMEFAFFEG
jgi:hypothetical protein